MGLRDVLRKKKELQGSQASTSGTANPQVVLLRADTIPQETSRPPGDAGDDDHLSATNKESGSRDSGSNRHHHRSLDVLLLPRHRSGSASSSGSSRHDGAGRRLSQRLHLSRQTSSEYVPQDLPDIAASADPADAEATESQWEERATMLAEQSGRARAASSSGGPPAAEMPGGHRPRSASHAPRPVSSRRIDEDIQEAIRLHEAGDLERATSLFARLADPEGAANPLSQVLYGLSLRHGWGCAPDPAGAVRYLTAAASNAGSVEQLALQAGMKKGGAAKGELVLAIFELANCFRHGWGIAKDPVAAKQYYETAANLGDTDAMNEVAWCYLEGYGCKKDKFTAARYYRLADKAGNKTLGNSWIWKQKYDPPEEHRGAGAK